MQLRHLKTVHAPQDGIAKVTGVCWSSNNRRLAVVTTDRVVSLYDEHGERRDKFSTKPADAKGPKNYVVRGMAWSPDSSKLAIAQSDNIVFVYKLGTEWGDKKSICNKFQQASSVTCVCWPEQRPNELVFGLAEGKMKVGQLRSNKPMTLYAADSYVVSCCSNLEGTAVLSGHLDQRIYRFFFDDASRGSPHWELCRHSCVPYALAWGEAVCAAGNDQMVTFYDKEGMELQRFDYSRDESEKEFVCAAFNPSGETVAVGSFNRFRTFRLGQGMAAEWEAGPVKHIENLYTITALAWKCDGSRLTVGSLCGAVDLFDACLRRVRYKGKFEFTYVSMSTVIVKRLATGARSILDSQAPASRVTPDLTPRIPVHTGARIILKSQFGYEITNRINIFQDRFLVGHTNETVLLGDLESCKLSEVPWAGGGHEKFYFDNEKVAMIFNAGELSLVEYGRNEILGACRTEHMSPHLISVRLNEARDPKRPELEVKKVAYLIDLQTIRVLDLATGITEATISHEAKVDWMEMNGTRRVPDAAGGAIRPTPPPHTAPPSRRRPRHQAAVPRQAPRAPPVRSRDADALHPPLLLVVRPMGAQRRRRRRAEPFEPVHLVSHRHARARDGGADQGRCRGDRARRRLDPGRRRRGDEHGELRAQRGFDLVRQRDGGRRPPGRRQHARATAALAGD